MLHELPNGKILTFLVDLTALSSERFDEIYNQLDKTAYSLKVVPGKQMLKVYWNFTEPISDFIECPSGWVRPCL